MRRSRQFLLLVLLALLSLPYVVAVNVSAESQKSRGEKHKAQPNPAAEPIQRQEPEVPLSVLNDSKAAVHELIDAQKQQAIAQQKQADAYKETWCSPPVIIQGVLAAVGFGYLIFMGIQARIASRTLILANRPKLKMRGFCLERDVEQDAVTVTNWDMKIGYDLVNHGGTEAIVIDSRHRVLMNPAVGVQPLPLPPDYGNDQITPARTRLKPGESRRFFVTGTVGPQDRVTLEPLVQQEHRNIAMHFHPFVFGYVVYSGRIGNSYRTAFCRRLQRKGPLEGIVFEPQKNPDYEYED